MTDLPGVTDPSWLLVEDQALKTALSGIQVTDGNQPLRNVAVFFGQPEKEVRKQTYPYMTIDLLDISENTPQVQSSYIPVNDPSMAYLTNRIKNADPNYAYSSSEWWLTPMLLTYQVASFARHPRHDRSIMSQLTHSIFHPRFAQIYCSDMTVRRLIVKGYVKRDTITPDPDGQPRRLYRNIWTIQIPSEIVYSPIVLTRRVETVNITTETPTSPDFQFDLTVDPPATFTE